MRPCTRRSVPAEDDSKATGLPRGPRRPRSSAQSHHAALPTASTVQGTRDPQHLRLALPTARPRRQPPGAEAVAVGVAAAVLALLVVLPLGLLGWRSLTL